METEQEIITELIDEYYNGSIEEFNQTIQSLPDNALNSVISDLKGLLEELQNHKAKKRVV